MNKPQPAPTVYQWTPYNAETPGSIRPDSIIVGYLTEPERRLLDRAAQLNNISHRLLRIPKNGSKPDRPCCTGVETCITLNGEQYYPREYMNQREGGKSAARILPNRVDEITLILKTDPGNIELPTDLAFLDQYYFSLNDSPYPIITRNSQLSVTELTDIMMAAFFECEDEPEYSRMYYLTETNFRRQAMQALENKEKATESFILEQLYEHIVYHLPEGFSATIRISQGNTEIVDRNWEDE